jgi:CheY-like chemotaxis protein
VLIPYTSGSDIEEIEAIPEKFMAPDAKVLVVDDVDINIMVVNAMLEDYGIVPDEALSGAAAIGMTEKKEYDLIFMDQMMPEMDGIEATAHIRKLSAYYGGSPIVVLTANVVNTSEKYFKDLGFNAFLSKPLEPGKLNHCLLAFLPRDKIIKEAGEEETDRQNTSP